MIQQQEAINHYNIGLSLYKKQNFEEAIESFNKTIEINKTDEYAFSGKALALNSLNKPIEALENFRKAIELNNLYAEAHLNEGLTLSRLARYSKALQSFNRAIAIDSNFIQAYYGLRHALISMNKFQEAIHDSYNKIIALNPSEALAYVNKGVAIHNMSEHETAIINYIYTSQ